MSFDHLIEDNTEGPDITADTIVIMFECLGRHVDGTTDIVVFVLIEIMDGDGESEISVFVDAIEMENVGRFDITVYVTCLMDLCVAFDELFHDFDGLVIREGFSFFENVVQVALA